MKEKDLKWYQTLLLAILLCVSLPLIIVFFLFAGLYVLFQRPKYKREYKCSRYYKDVGGKFFMDVLSSPQYRFYNGAVSRSLPIKYVRQASNGLEYFIFDGTLYLFPNFERIDYDIERSEWLVSLDGSWEHPVRFDEAFETLLAKLDDAPALPVKLFLETETFLCPDLNQVEIPECIYLAWTYGTAFENDDSPLKMLIPQNVAELYEMMLQTSDLCGDFHLCEDLALGYGQKIEWQLNENVKIELAGDTERDNYFGVYQMSFGKSTHEITHVHPSATELYGIVCKIGKRGNVMVIRSTWTGSTILYMGRKENCPYFPDQKRLFGKLYYIEAK